MLKREKYRRTRMKNTQQALILFIIFFLLLSGMRSRTMAVGTSGLRRPCDNGYHCTPWCGDCGYCGCVNGECVSDNCPPASRTRKVKDSGFEG
ncbi:hypothetical protein HanRHA438_Chr08g0336581 [Helianthus annuus]|nr:hypothetical protein HanHA300_Chr08g0268901 [Helianthus annuus]KAJ0545594.1 hypothetical protein HanIR_Chr08g0351541 [Helianthus annuus]KAJ0552486.1 hypothetical protein HanHA89_Chr08g0285781 [Helianthus annuus]KAJ0896614.1 hypothetical protein HanRHA438_Chr08g0336581 [Helianthus annuus]